MAALSYINHGEHLFELRHVFFYGIVVVFILNHSRCTLKLWRKNMIIRLITFYLMLCQRFNAASTNSYFLIGDNEDGCNLRVLKYCACVLQFASDQYCGHIDQWPVYCQPEANPETCIDGNLFYKGNHSQSLCISEVFQSIQSPLPSVNEDFCKKNNVTTCDERGLNCS